MYNLYVGVVTRASRDMSIGSTWSTRDKEVMHTWKALGLDQPLRFFLRSLALPS